MVSPQLKLLQGEQKEVLNVGVLVTSAWALLASIYANNEEVKLHRINAENQHREHHEHEEHLISLDRDRDIQNIYKDVEDIANETEYYKLWSLDLPLPFDTKPGISSIPTQNLIIIESTQKSTQNLEQLISGYAKSGHMIVMVTTSKTSFEWEIHLLGSKVSATHRKRLFNQVRHIVDQLKKSPSVTMVRDLDLICLNDLEHIQKWNNNLPVPVEDCIHYIIGRRAEESPNSPAVCAWDGSLTYQELSDLSNRLAKHLIELGVGLEVFVPICFEKSVWSIVSLVAILKAGGACVPLDPAHPKSRHQAILGNLKPSLIVCSQSLEGLCRELEYPVVTVTSSTIQALPLNCEVLDPTQVVVRPGNAAFAVFTSGSTGQPKGIIIEHGAMCTSARDHGAVMKFGPRTRVIQFAAFTFDDSFSDVFTTLMYGGCICVPSDHDRLNNLAKCIVQMDANQACLTTTIARQLHPEDVPCLKVLSVGGEALTSQLLEQWADHVYLINAYGPAEASIFCSALAGLSTTDDPNNVGTALGCLLWITDTVDHNKLLPIGAVGELLIEGPILARCYIQNKEKTEAAFIENPTWARLENGSQTSNRRFYKTGDLARYNEDGTMQILGRKDTQVKLRGQRIELGEIEHHVLREVKGCLEVGVEVIKPNNGAGAPMIAAFLRMQSDSIPDANLLSVVKNSSDVLDGVEARLTQLLPPYMVPAAFVCLPKMPLMVSGKLDRKALRELGSRLSMDQLMGPGQTNAADGSGSPQTAMEKKLQEIWSRVLNLPLDQIGVNSSFLKLGGDSFTAIQVTSTCRAENIEITVQDILKSKILSQVALKARALASSFPDIEEEIGTQFKLNPIQRWNMHRTSNVAEAVKNHFNQSFVFRLRMHIQLSRLKWVIEQVLARHIMLRSRFKKLERSDQWSQSISKDIENYHILREHNVPSMDTVEHIIHQTQKSFDLQKGPLFGADLINLPDGSQLLFLAIHHMVIDLVSWRIVLEDMETLLTSGVLTALNSLPFSTWVKKQIQCSQKRATSAHASSLEVCPANFAYWGMEDRPNISGDAIKQVISVPTSISSLILGTCNEPLKTDVVDLLLSAVIHSFGQSFTDRTLPTIFNCGHGRESWDPLLDISRTVGCFTIMCPISIPGGDPSSIIQVVKETKDTRHRIPKNGFDYFTSRHLTDDGAEVFGHHDQMEILFHYSDVYQQFGQEDSLFDQMPLETFNLGDSSALMPASALFEIEVGIEQGEIQFTFSYNQFMRHQHKISNWINECGKSVETLAHCLSEMQPEFTLSDFPLLSLNYSGLDIFMKQTLPKLEIDSLGRIENIYPCSPMQEGILVAQKKRAHLYRLEEIFKVSPRGSGTIDITRLERAWKQVVARHPVLRTMCVESFSENTGFQQVVLGAYEPRVFHVQAKDRPGALRTFKNYTPANYSDPEPRHRFGICQLENGDVYFRLEIDHTLNDAMSDQIICKEIGLAYDGLLPNTPGPLYSEYIHYIKCQPTSLTLGYWKNYLADIKPCRFPILNDGEVQSSGDINTLVIPFHGAGLMDSFCKAQGLTIGNLMTTVWGLLLQTYTGESDVCFGYLTSSRDLPIPDVQDIVGPLINMVISRVSLPDSELLMNVIRKAQDDYINASPYQVCSLAEVYHALDLGGDKLFNTAISLEKKELNDLAGGSSIAIEEIEVYDPTDFELMLKVAYSGTDFRAAITYNTASISDKHASKIADTFEKILTSVLELPEQKVADVERLGIENVTQLLAWNKNLPDSLEKCVHDAVHEQALLYPNLPAVSSWDGELTYTELDDMSTRFSHYLSQAGVGLEIVVPIASEKSRWVIVSQLGVLKAGGACLTMDMSNPIDRLKGMCKQVNAKLLIAAPNHKDTFQDTGINTVIVDEAFIRSLPSQNEVACTTVKPNNMGFIVFTSGSTGNPKGIMLEHRTVCTASRGQQALFDIGPGSRCLQFSSYAFDVHISDIFVPLMYGGCCCIPSETQRMGDLAGAIREAKATSTHITPTVSKQFQPEDVPLLKKVAFCGEAFTHESAKTWSGSLYAINIFGPAETSNWVSYRHVLPDTTQPSNIGSGVGVNIWLVDHQTNTHLVPVGCAGEMFIEGPILARGYLNDSAKTEAAFIKDPEFLRKYGGGAGRRVYKTGDLARTNTDGTFLYIGRVDSQVKIYGQRLELGEVEYAISEFPEVKHVAVVLPKSGLYNGHLVAVIVLHGITEDHGGKSLRIISAARKTEIQSKVSSLIDQISIRLAAWMVPHFWAIVNDIPSGATDKLDRGRVKQFITDINQETVEQISALTVEDQLDMPKTNVEKQLRDAWSKILGVPHDRIGMDSSFLRLGGDSLSIMRLVAEARSHGINLSTVSVFRHPKLKDMALEATGGESEVVSEIAPFSLLGEASMVESIREEAARECSVSAELIEDIYPCTPLQEGLMVLSITQPGTYMAQYVYKLPPGLDLIVFRQAWQLVYKANAILRTRVINMEALGTVQVVVSDEISWSTGDQLEVYIKKDKETKMLPGLPLSRFAVIEGHFIITAHHAIYDAWSLNGLLEDAVAAYQQQSLETHVPYKHFIKHVQELDQKAAESFWISELSNENTKIFPSIPYPKYQPKADTFLVQDIQVSRKPGSEITTPTILEAAWALVSSQYAGDTDVTFGLLVSGRNASLPGVARIRGPTIATVPVQVRIDHDLSLETFLRQIQNQITEMMPFEQTGLQSIRQLNTATQAACNFQTQLVIQASGKTQTGLQPLGIDRANDDSDDVLTYALTFECVLTSTGLTLNTLFDSDVIPSSQMKRIIQQFANMVQALSEESSRTTVNDILIINAQDEREILTWNSTLPEFVEKIVHEEIHQQALSHPDAPAICAWDGDLTYKELDTLSSQLGYFLRKLGVKPEVSVAYCFEKSKWCIVSILAIMKAGGICVPLDPDHPITRKQAMVQDVNSNILLTSAKQLDHCLGIVEQIFVVDNVLLGGLPDAPSVVCPELHPRHPVYVIFTSGSTGKPKAVVWEHRTLSSSVAKHGSALHFNRRPRVLHFASHVFDASVAEVIDTLTYGGCLCIPSDSDKTTNFVQYINVMHVDWVFLTPTFARLIRPQDVPGLKTLSLGGEPIGQDNIRNWSEKVQLINAYGPSECCILATTHEFTSASESTTTIGQSTGGLVWIVDINDINKLAPIGAVGEMLVEGPTLAIGYLHNPEKTAESFISNPKWSQRIKPAGCHQDQPRRFYRTGDLGRYNADGTISFNGRKDNQVKIRGQRVELGEVEHTLMKNSLVQHAITVVATSGPCRGQLVAALTLSERTIKGKPTPLRILSAEVLSETILNIQEEIAETLPVSMIPSVWLPVEDLPQTTTGKLDRVTVKQWVNNITQETLDTINRAILDKTLIAPTTPTEKIIQSIWSHVLKIPLEQIGSNSTFMKLGGDSITAIQVASRSRQEGIEISVPDILRYGTLSELALYAIEVDSVAKIREEPFDVPFQLSPIQQLYMQQLSSPGVYFNQSFLLQIANPVNETELRAALETIVRHHSMLRARFIQSESGDWSQLITSNIDNSFQLTYHKNTNDEYIECAVIKSQAGLDIRNGPLFSADVFEDVLISSKGRQLIFITAHHLGVDLVSKRIILQDLEDILKSGAPRHHQSLPFQSWLSLQRQRAQSFLTKKPLRTSIPLSNYAYWGMEGRNNLVSDIKVATITIATDKTAKLLSAANNPLRTEPLDLLLASTIHAFAQTFNDRDLPAIFNEGHGRDTWDSAIDISRTVGWFTVISPLVVEASSDIVSTIRAIKDARRRSSQEGISSFSSSLFDETDHGVFQAYEKMELVFNYSDQYQQLERADSLMSQTGLDIDLHDLSPGMEQSGLFHIDATLENGTLKVAFRYNRHMQQEARILKFFSKCRQVLEEISDRLPLEGRQFTETDFPLLNMEPAHLIKLTELLPQLNLTSLEEVEDIYPCSPMQEGILASQAKDASLYLMNNMFEIKCRLEDASVDASRFVAAWHAVVHRHSVLRTIFIPSISDDKSMYQQLVLKNVVPKVFFVTGSSDGEGLANLTDHVRLDTTQLAPGHQLSIFESLDTGSLFLRLEINHAIMDASSTELILSELSQAYDNQLSISRGPLYSDYIAYLSKQSKVDALEYWTKYLEGATPSLLSSVNCGPEKSSGMQSIDVQIPNAALVHTFCAQHSLTVANVLQSAWALVLQCYTGHNSVSFGYISSGRDLPISNISECIGPLINFLTCRVQIDSSASVLDFIRRIQGDHSNHLSHRAISMAEVQHALGLGGEKLFNTGFSVQKVSNQDVHGALTYKHLDSQNPSEFAFVMNTTYSRTAIEAMISYQGNLISEAHARNIHDTFNQVLSSLLHSADKPVSEIEKVGVFNKQQLFKWNSGVIPEIPDLIHDRFHAEVGAHPNSEAICAWDGSLTYLELDQLSTELSLHLKKIGVTTEKLVPFCFEKSIWTIVAVLAIIKAGGACVPLDPTHPRGRKEVMVKTVGAQLILCSQDYAAECATLVDDVFVVNQATIQALPTADYRELRDVPGAIIRPENSVYIVFTSGSTGQPKGVVWAHANLSSSITYHGAMFEMSRQTRMFQFASHVFDASALEILTTLLHGGCVCIPSDQDKLVSFTTYINSQNVNTAFLTATFARQVDPNLVPSLKKLILGGEPVGQDNASKWSGRLKLINGWGTTETTIACAAGVIKPTSSNINSIGSPYGSHFWITDPEDIQKLVPIGAVGELLVEGPILARGYLNDPEKTRKSFISSPSWAQSKDTITPRRWYRTGDLAKYEPDGTLVFIGRRDNQTKVRGQRIELSEVEHNLLEDDSVEHVLATVPKSGLLQGKLVVSLTLKHLSNRQAKLGKSSMAVLSQEYRDEVSSQVSKITETLEDKVPAYMVPTVWIPFEDLLYTVTGKLDRVAIGKWIENVDQYALDHINEVVHALHSTQIPMTSMEAKLQVIFAEVLNLPLEQITGKSSFLKLGGDSITAIQVHSKARSQKIILTVPTILRCKTLSETAIHAKIADSSIENTQADESLNQPFSLSPIQQMQIENIAIPGVHFNQSFLVKMNITVSPADVRKAIEVLVQQHSLLRARFHAPADSAKDWSLSIVDNVSKSYELHVHANVPTAQDMENIIYQTQKRINVFSGPLFAADFFVYPSDTGKTSNPIAPSLFLTASHLVVDLVSWRIILQDLEEIFTTGALTSSMSLPFQTWMKLQTEHIMKESESQKSVEADVQASNLGYWGMEDQKNKIKDMVESNFHLTKDETSLLLREANDPFTTETLDLLISAVILSFQQTFHRRAPTIYNEGHGREAWDETVDISRTVGWFTTLCPIHIGDAVENSLLNIIRKVKDARAKMPRNGWQEFGSRFLTEEGRKSSRRHNPEIVFNYAGQYQQLERADAAFSSIEDMNLHEQSPNLQLPGLINIMAVVQHGTLKVSFTHNKLMKHQAELPKWIGASKLVMRQMVSSLPHIARQFTLSDLPYLNLDYQGLDAMMNHIRSQLSPISTKVQDIFPASDYQADSLASTLSKSKANLNYLIFDIYGPLDVSQLQESLIKLLDRHASLRSLFMVHERHLLQVVLEEGYFDFAHYSDGEYDPAVVMEADLENPIELGKSNIKFILVNQGRDHQTLILRIPHAYFDSISMGLIIHDLQAIYGGSETTTISSYSDYSKYKADNSIDAKVYWRESLRGASPINFFGNVRPRHKDHGYAMIYKSIPLPSLQQHDVQVASIVKGAWAILLAELSGRDDVIFGDLANGRNVPISGIESMSDGVINYIPFRVRVKRSVNVLDFLQAVQEQQLANMPFEFLGTREIISHCTNWPAWATFGSTVNHTNYPFSHKPLSEETTTWKFDLFLPGGNQDDLMVESHPNGDMLDVNIGFGNKMYPQSYVESLLERLCSNITKLAKSPQATIATFLDDGSSLARSLPIPHAIGPIPLRSQVVSINQDVQASVRRVWERALNVRLDDLILIGFKISTPFHAIWSHPIAAAHLAQQFQGENIDTNMDEILSAPSMEEQIILFSRKFKNCRDTRRSVYGIQNLVLVR